MALPYPVRPVLPYSVRRYAQKNVTMLKWRLNPTQQGKAKTHKYEGEKVIVKINHKTFTLRLFCNPIPIGGGADSTHWGINVRRKR